MHGPETLEVANDWATVVAWLELRVQRGDMERVQVRIRWRISYSLKNTILTSLKDSTKAHGWQGILKKRKVLVNPQQMGLAQPSNP